MELLNRLREAADDLFQRLNRASGGTLGVIRRTIRCYGERNASKWAASLAYYIFFALFPLLLLIVVAMTYALNLDSEEALQQAVNVITEAIPISQDLVSNNLQTIVDLRGTVTLISGVGLIWSASSAFAVLSHSINEAFEMAKPRGFVKQRLFAVGMVVILLVLLILSLFATTVLQILSDLEVFGLQLGFLGTLAGMLIQRLAPLILSFAMFVALYRWVPTEGVVWRAVLWGAGVAAVGWELAKQLFEWYIQSGASDYDLVYGSLSGVVVLLFWIYISASIVLFGAHLASVIDPNVSTQE